MLKIALIAFGALALAAVLGLMWRLFRAPQSAPVPPAIKQPALFDDLRNQLLHGSRNTFGLQASSSTGPVWGVLMETGFPEATASLIALSDGSASLYFSTGGGVIGGGDHAIVRAAAIEFVRLAGQDLSTMAPVTQCPLPATGQTVFYVLTDTGILVASAAEGDLGEGRHHLSRLFYAGHDVITPLLEASNSP